MRFLLLLLLAAPAFADEDPIARERIIALSNHVTEINKRVDQRFVGAELAVEKANVALEKRLDSVNEFRAQLKDQSAQFVTRNELWGYFVGVIGLVTTVVTVVVYLIRGK